MEKEIPSHVLNDLITLINGCAQSDTRIEPARQNVRNWLAQNLREHARECSQNAESLFPEPADDGFDLI